MVRIERSDIPPRNEGDPAELTWIVSPERLGAVKMIGLSAALLGVLLGAFILFRSGAFALMCTVLLLGSLIDRLVPRTYRMDRHGVRVRIGPVTWLDMPWHDVRSVLCTPRGLKLSPFDNPATARLENRRGIQLVFDASLADRVAGTIERLRWAGRPGDAN